MSMEAFTALAEADWRITGMQSESKVYRNGVTERAERARGDKIMHVAWDLSCD
jgi:hypothetical protein